MADKAGTVKYLEQIRERARASSCDTLYAGPHLKTLHQFLSLADQERWHASESDKSCPEGTFSPITMHHLDPRADRGPISIKTLNHFQRQASHLIQSEHGHLVFVRGHPAPDWLLLLGSLYQIHPDLLLHHLDYKREQPFLLSLPSLPSASTSVLQLPLTTIGKMKGTATHKATESRLDWFRRKAQSAIEKYRQSLQRNDTHKSGDSVVRECSIHNATYFSIEQYATALLCQAEKSWAVIILLDVGKDLGQSSAATAALPLRDLHVQHYFLPTIQHRPGITSNMKRKPMIPLESKEQSDYVQSASLLHDNYGLSLRRSTCRHDAFYALHELFMFSAFTETQFLNLLDSELALGPDMMLNGSVKSLTLANILYTQNLLDRHVSRLRTNLKAIRTQTWSDICRQKSDASDESLAVIKASNHQLQADFEEILHRAERLVDKCDKGAKMIMYHMQMNESRRAIDEAEGLAKLTRLAFFYIPLSFTTSLFGMNILQLNNSGPSIWVWIMVSALVLAGTFAILRLRNIVHYFASKPWQHFFASQQAKTTQSNLHLMDGG